MDDNKMADLLKNRFHIEAAKQDRGGVYALTQRKMAYNSNRIEGSTLTEKQTASIFETGTIQADSEDLIKAYHFRLKAGVFEDIANGYPSVNIKTEKILFLIY